MPPMPPMPPISGISGPESGLGSSATKVSVVSTSPPIEPADCSAFLVTLTDRLLRPEAYPHTHWFWHYIRKMVNHSKEYYSLQHFLPVLHFH